MSRHRARLVIDGEDVTVEDLGSKNGTYVGDEQVASRRRLVDGERPHLYAFDAMTAVRSSALSVNPFTGLLAGGGDPSLASISSSVQSRRRAIDSRLRSAKREGGSGAATKADDVGT